MARIEGLQAKLPAKLGVLDSQSVDGLTQSVGCELRILHLVGESANEGISIGQGDVQPLNFVW